LEDILSILVVILIAVASTTKKKKKKKAKAPDSKGPVSFSPGSSDKGFSEMKEFIVDVGKTILEMEDDDEIDAPAKVKTAKMKPKQGKTIKTAKPAIEPAKPAVSPRHLSVIEEGLASSQGRSLFEDKGCIGGSIPHDSHEGDSMYPYGLDRDDESSVYAGDIALEIQNMNLNKLRRAVVISEILDKPKALRRH